MRRPLYLAAPILLLLASIAFLLLGQYIWAYRDHLHTTDPTAYHVNTDVSLAILIPAIMSLFISAAVIIARVRELKGNKS